MAMASASVDRLSQVPGRLAFLFDYAPERTLADARAREELGADGARSVVTALAAELASAPRLDREKFRAVANQVKARSGQKGRALLHPIRLVLTGRAQGPELDMAVPAIDLGADLPESAGIPKIIGCRERAASFSAALDARR
jgi:glutamyl/glutaminyl-tRNA synthetase